MLQGKIRTAFLLSFLSVFLIACEKDSQNSTSNWYKSYYDTSFGRFIDYEVTEINHDENAAIQHDTLNYFLRIRMDDTIVDNLGRIATKYVRYKKNNVNDPWQLSDVWTTIVDGANAELVEENQRKVKLKFPINEFTKWDANVFNLDEKLDCSYENMHVSRSINGLFFDSTIMVNQGEKRDFLRFYKRKEIYANGIGMISKYLKDLDISNFDTLQIKSGKETYMQVINFGK
jgi:hypothetical protein